ncbi:General transcription factor IIH subunit 2 [Taenia solium]|eukprot:TsM_001069600 transcript=TsM_001069600 gene=TsM_001069600
MVIIKTWLLSIVTFKDRRTFFLTTLQFSNTAKVMSQPSDKRDYSWVAGYEKTWESIKEDQSGSLVASLEKMVRDTHADLRAKRQHTNATATTIGGTPRLGMVYTLDEPSGGTDSRPIDASPFKT